MSIMNNLRDSGVFQKLTNNKLFLDAPTGEYETKEVTIDEHGNTASIQVPILVKSEAWVELIPPQSAEFINKLQKIQTRLIVANRKAERANKSDNIEEIDKAKQLLDEINADAASIMVVNWSDHFGVPCNEETKRELFLNPEAKLIINQINHEIQNIESFVEVKKP
ncbi:TPA: hypothetical protein ACX6NV_002018 [Photobacterium damselae]